MKRLGHILALFVCAAHLAHAEDTDIYINTTPDQGVGDAWVMLALDWRPNLSSNVCASSSECLAPGEWVEQCSGSYVPQCSGTESTVCSGTEYCTSDIDGTLVAAVGGACPDGSSGPLTCDTGYVTTCTFDDGTDAPYVDVCDGNTTQACLDTSSEPATPVEVTEVNECDELFGEYMPEKDSCVADADICIDAAEQPVAFAAGGACPEGSYLVAAEEITGEPVDGVCPAGTTLTEGDYRFFDLIVAALRQVVEPLDNVHLGLMMSHTDTRHKQDGCTGPTPTYANDNCANGGFIFSGFKDMGNTQQKEDFFARLSNIPLPKGNAAHQYQGREMYFEFARYLTGQRVYNGHNGWGDYGTQNDDPPWHNIDNPLDVPPYVDQSSLWSTTYPSVLANGSWDTSIEEALGDGTYRYIAPQIDTDGQCGSVYIVNLMHQVANQQVESDSAISEAICTGNGCLDGGLGLGRGSGTDTFPDIIDWFADADRLSGTTNNVDLPSIKSFFLVDETKINNKTQGYAQAGQTQVPYVFSQDPGELQSTLGNIFAQILSASTTFSAPAVPVNVFNRAESQNDVFISIFQPAEEGTPQWYGNLKKLKLAEDPATGARTLVDQTGLNAVGADGRIAASALTFWTLADELTPPEAGETDFTATSDGRGVRRGGAGQVMPGSRDVLTQLGPGLENPSGSTTSTSARKLFTEPTSHTNGVADDLLPFNATVGTAVTLLADDAALNTMLTEFVNASADATDTAQSVMLDMMKHARGIDVTDEDGDALTDDSRPWFFGPALHGRPLPINYGGPDADNQDVRVMLTNNDGWVRLFGPGDNDGVEDWAFMPRAVMAKLKRLMDNSPGTDPLHPHLVDGEISMLLIDNDGDTQIETGDGDRVITVFGQRRGGKNYWALDVSDPDDPHLLWAIGRDESCNPDTNDFCELAQTWSPMRAVRLSVDYEDDNGPQDVLAFIFAGGYNGDDDGDKLGDLGKDARTSVCTGTTSDVCDGTLSCSDGNPPVNGACLGDGATLQCDVGFRTACFDETGDEIPYQTELLGTNDAEGNAIFIVDAFTGALIWKAVQGNSTGADALDSTLFTHTDLNDSMPAEVALLDSNSDGRLDRFYIGDTAGVVWRGDLASSLRSGWTLTKIASVGRHYADATLENGATVVDDRRIFPRVDVVRSSDALGDYDGILIGTGDRTHPLGGTVQNYFYLFKDRYTTSGIAPNGGSDVIMHDDVLDLTDNCLASGNLSDCSADVDAAQAQLDKGWRLKLEQCENLVGTGDCGEKALASPLVVQGIVLFNTYVPPNPDTTSCAPKEGEGLLYAVSLEQATPVLNFDSTNDGSGITLDRFDKLASGGIPSQLVPIGYGDILRGDLKFTNIPGFAGAKTFWFEEDRN